jgi:predicted membrane protein
MENNNKINHASNSRIWSGLILLVIGLIFLLRNFGIEAPDWLLSWPMGLIVIGLLVGFKRNFQGLGWIIMVAVGGYFMASKFDDPDLTKYYLAVVLIGMGLYLILKPKSDKFCRNRFKESRRFRRRYGRQDTAVAGEPVYAAEEPVQTGDGFTYADKEDADILDSVNVLGGSHQNVFSKNFKGGDVIAIFGGCDVNLTQADFKGTIVLDIVAIFGGAKIVVPQSWEVKSEVTAIFGGLDDKRGLAPVPSEERKVLIIKGVALFGGVEIKNF